MSELALGMSLVLFLVTLFTLVIKPKIFELMNKINNYLKPDQFNQIRGPPPSFNFMNYKKMSPPRDLPKQPIFSMDYHGFNSFNSYNSINASRSLFTPTPIKKQYYETKPQNNISKVYVNTSLDLTPGFKNLKTKEKNTKINYTPSHLDSLQGKISSINNYDINQRNNLVYNNPNRQNTNIYSSKYNNYLNNTKNTIFSNNYGQNDILARNNHSMLSSVSHLSKITNATKINDDYVIGGVNRNNISSTGIYNNLFGNEPAIDHNRSNSSVPFFSSSLIGDKKKYVSKFPVDVSDFKNNKNY